MKTCINVLNRDRKKGKQIKRGSCRKVRATRPRRNDSDFDFSYHLVSKEKVGRFKCDYCDEMLHCTYSDGVMHERICRKTDK